MVSTTGRATGPTEGDDVSETSLQRDQWTPERVAMVKKGCCPAGIPEHEADLFIEQCKRSGLDPLLKEAFCVSRRQNVGNRERPVWVTKYEFQPSEAGMLARAERFPDFKGIQASAVFAEDEFIMDQGEGKVVHRFNPAKRKGSLVGGWSRVEREGKLPVLVWLDFSGYVQQTPLWAKIPTTMIEKCARVAALRKAYPAAFGGLYIREEMPEAEYSTPTEPARAGPVGKDPAQVQVERELAGQAAPGAGRVPEAASTPVSGAESSATAKGAVVVAFGPHKGKTARELTDDELSETIDLAHEKLIEQPRARWAKAMRENLTALEAETELRCRLPSPEQGLQVQPEATPPAQVTTFERPARTPRSRAAREPGSDDDESPAPNPFGEPGSDAARE